MNTQSERLAAVVALLLAATLAAGELSDRREPEKLDMPLESIPLDIDGWTGHELDKIDEATARILNASNYLNRSYTKGGREVRFFTAFYAMQRHGQTTHSPKHCLPGAGWEIWDYASVDVSVGDEPVTINKYFIQKGRQRRVVYYWYQTKDRVMASEYYAKICLVVDAVFRGRTSGSIVRLVLPDEPWADEVGPAFAAKIIPLLRDRLPSGA